jgi:hypothetical protein
MYAENRICSSSTWPERLAIRIHLHLPQHETEVMLRARVRELGGIVEQGVGWFVS